MHLAMERHLQEQHHSFTAIFRGGGETELTLEMADVTTAATTFNISRNTGLADGMYLTLSKLR